MIDFTKLLLNLSEVSLMFKWVDISSTNLITNGLDIFSTLPKWTSYTTSKSNKQLNTDTWQITIALYSQVLIKLLPVNLYMKLIITRMVKDTSKMLNSFWTHLTLLTHQILKEFCFSSIFYFLKIWRMILYF